MPAPASPRRPTMVDVAQRAGVSLKTVSRVVNNEPAVAQDLVDRVLSAIAELGFRRNDIARNLRSGRVNATIGLLIEEIANPFYATIASVVTETAKANDTLLITASSEEDPGRERELLLDLCQRRVDGLLVVPAGADHSFLRREVEMGMPVVFLDRPAGQLLADTVLLDNRGGAQAGVQRLLKEGHRRIGILHDSLSVYTMRERLAGAQDALAEAGMRYDEALVRDGMKTPDEAALTVGALQELWRRGNDADLVGFDDFELAHLMPRPFTVIAYDTRALARTGAELLFRRIRGDRSWPSTKVLPTRLVRRGLRADQKIKKS